MFIYAIKSAIVLSLLYLPYLLMLRRESFFRFNRMMLCIILLASVLLPLCNLPVLSMDGNPVVNAAQMQMVEVGIPIAGRNVQEPPGTVSGVSWFAVVAALYAVVAVMLMLLRMHDYIRLRRIIGRDCLWKKSEGGITVCCHAGDMPPFSWYRTIVIGSTDYAQNGECIIRHETGHIVSGHSWDILLLTVVQLLQWFNPLVWVLGQSLQDVHEYEADDYVLQGGITLDEYRLLLIQKAVGASPYVFANSFSHSLLKKRIMMMCRHRSSPWLRLKALYALPAALLALSAFATPEFEKVSKAIGGYIVVNGRPATSEDLQRLSPGDIRSVTVMKGASAIDAFGEKGKDGVVAITTRSNADKVEEARFPGEVMQWVSGHLRYPKEALELGAAGRIKVSFTVEADGSISNVSSVEDSEPDTALGSDIHVVSPAPAKEKTAQAAQEQDILAARRSLRNEAERVVRQMPHWHPATKDGQPVSTRIILPITFRLQ